MCDCFVYMYVCAPYVCLVPEEVTSGTGWLWPAMWVLGIRVLCQSSTTFSTEPSPALEFLFLLLLKKGECSHCFSIVVKHHDQSSL